MSLYLEAFARRNIHADTRTNFRQLKRTQSFDLDVFFFLQRLQNDIEHIPNKLICFFSGNLTIIGNHCRKVLQRNFLVHGAMILFHFFFY